MKEIREAQQNKSIWQDEVKELRELGYDILDLTYTVNDTEDFSGMGTFTDVTITIRKNHQYEPLDE